MYPSQTPQTQFTGAGWGKGYKKNEGIEKTLQFERTLPKRRCTASFKKGYRKVQGLPQSQAAALPRHQEEQETDSTKQVQIKQTYEKY